MRIAAVLLLAACGGGGGGGPGPDAGDDPSDLVGRIAFQETEFGDGVTASVSVWFNEPDTGPDLVNDGTCRVYEYPCLGSVGACASPPPPSAGTVTITGVSSTLTLTHGAFGYTLADPLPDDLFADAATISVTATGDEVAAFSVSVGGVTPMVSPYVDATLGLVAGQAYALTWTPGSTDARIQFLVNWNDICHAGAERYVLQCDVADTGAFTVPAAITGALPANFEQCGAQLRRFRRAVVPGRDIELVVATGDFFGYF
jgi:hypothetical protein